MRQDKTRQDKRVSGLREEREISLSRTGGRCSVDYIRGVSFLIII